MSSSSLEKEPKLNWTKINAKPDPVYGLPCARSSHGVSLVQKGSRLVVYGGEHVARTPITACKDTDNGGVGACWILDLKKNDDETPTWRRLDVVAKEGESVAAAVFPPDRIAHSQAVHDDKYVYIFGGRAGIHMQEAAMNDLWVLDCSGLPGSETWSQVLDQKDDSSIPEARSFHRMICMNDTLYVFGGCGETSGRLADLHSYNISTKTWTTLPKSSLRGRGGPNLVSLDQQTKLGVIAGFAGEETSDGQIFDLKTNAWNESLLTTETVFKGLRPRSVCIAESFDASNNNNNIIIFGGQVDPSDRGHEGAGGFENDVLLFDSKTAQLLQTIPCPKSTDSSSSWPEQRGWSDGAGIIINNDDDDNNNKSQLYIFGGLAGDDKNPRRLDDLWRLDIN